MRSFLPSAVRGSASLSAPPRRAWLAAWLQDRRRKRQNASPPAPIPNAPVITGAQYEWEDGWARTWIWFTFDHATFPHAELEAWTNVNGGAFVFQEAIWSTETEWSQPGATDVPATIGYRFRYRNGPLLGPFSTIYELVIAAP